MISAICTFYFSVTSVVLISWDYSGSVKDLIAGFQKHVFANKYETLKMAVPSLVYALQVSQCSTVKCIFSRARALKYLFLHHSPIIHHLPQNNLSYVALSNLDAATFQVTYQFKIVTSAVLMYYMMKKELSTKQWISIFVLTAGRTR